MPYYDYRCTKCGLIKEIKHPINERWLASCPRCPRNTEDSKMIPKISCSPVHFKGSGFYETDYKGK